MKITNLLLFLLTSLILGCKESGSENVRSFIPGTYVAQWSDEFSKTIDTLNIIQQTESGSLTYQISQHIFSHYYNKMKKPRYRNTQWIGSYDEINKSLLININGRVFSFDPEKNELKSGTTIFKKYK